MPSDDRPGLVVTGASGRMGQMLIEVVRASRRARLAAASAYLDVAPRVVRVALDAPVPDVDLAVPTAVTDPEALLELARTYGVENPVGRVLAALGLAG